MRRTEKKPYANENDCGNNRTMAVSKKIKIKKFGEGVAPTVGRSLGGVPKYILKIVFALCGKYKRNK